MKRQVMGGSIPEGNIKEKEKKHFKSAIFTCGSHNDGTRGVHVLAISKRLEYAIKSGKNICVLFGIIIEIC